VINYNLCYEKSVVSTKNFEVNLDGSGALGTLYTNIDGGFMLRTGLLNPYFKNLGISKRPVIEEDGLHKTQFLFSLKSNVKFVGYDGTLQGGMFNHTSVYTIGRNKISRVVYQGSACLTFSYGGFGISVEQFLLSPEFHNGWWHKWVHIGLAFCL
jgi:hypothetical protein